MINLNFLFFFYIFSSQNKSQVISSWVNYIVLDSLWISISIFNEGNSSFWSNTIGVIDISPDTFNIPIIYVLYSIDLSCLRIAGCKMVKSLPLPDSQLPVSHSNIIIGVILSESCNKVPRLVLSRNHSNGIGNQESQPESIAIFIQVLKVIPLLVNNWFALSVSWFQWLIFRWVNLRSGLTIFFSN